MRTFVCSLLMILAVLSSTPEPAIAQSGGSTVGHPCPGEQGYYYTNYRRRNPQRGGFVANTAIVADNTDDIFIGPEAAICGNAIVEGRPRIAGNVIVRGNARINGDNILLTGNVVIEGNAVIGSNTRIFGRGVLASGSHSNVERELTAPATPPRPVVHDRHELFEQLKRSVPARIVPASGDFYRGQAELRQTFDYSGNVCTLVIGKRRMPLHGEASSSFYGTSRVRLQLADAYEIRVADWSSHLSTVDILMRDYKEKARRYYTYPTRSQEEQTWINHNARRFANTVESIEFLNRSEAVAFQARLQQLMTACKAS